MTAVLTAPAARAQDTSDQPYWLEDRGPGLPTSLFGSYIGKGELLVYPFYEFTYNSDEEYSPAEFGFGGPGASGDFEGELFLHELLMYYAYAPTDWLAAELEFAYYANGTLDKSNEDPSFFPNSLDQSGFGDLQFQVRWRWFDETEWRPYFFNWLEVVPPLYGSNKTRLVGETDWELVYGAGLIKGFRWGTVTGRVSMQWNDGEGNVEVGEYAVEYLKRLSESWRAYAGIEGQDDEVSFIPEIQYFFRENIYLKFNVGVGLTPKAPDVAPEIGVMFVF